MKFEHTVSTSASHERIWAIWTDVPRWPEWDTELVSASITDGPFALGVTGTLRPKTGPTSTFVVSEMDPGTSYAFTTRLPLGRLVVRRQLMAEPQGETRFTHQVAFAGALSGLVGVLLGRRFRSALPGVMNNIRVIAERSS